MKKSIEEKAKKNIFEGLIITLATVCFLGYSPYASGTVGALPGLAVAVLMLYFKTPAIVYTAVTVFMIIAAIPICSRAEKFFGIKDCRYIVLDEMVSMPITLFLIGDLRLHIIIIAFILNRLADIVKVPPAYQSQKLPGGWGIVLDDVIAGIYSNLALRAFIFILPR
jgi:phosphatidylglycerophosphatase A